MDFSISLGESERIVTSEEQSRFAKLLQLDQIAPGRCSKLLLAELILWNEIHRHEPFQVARQIKALEDAQQSSGTKKETQFRKAPLCGLWHKHFFDAHFVAKNLQNEWSGDRLGKLFREVCGTDESQVFSEEMANTLIHRLVHGAIEERNEDERLTGEWIIFDKHEGQNYYLCLARHTDGDDVIYSKLKNFVFPEFQFLEQKYGESP